MVMDVVRLSLFFPFFFFPTEVKLDITDERSVFAESSWDGKGQWLEPEGNPGTWRETLPR